MSQLTQEQNEIMLELFDNVHDLLHFIKGMADGLYEAHAEVENSLLEALKCLDPDPPDMENVVYFPTGKTFNET